RGMDARVLRVDVGVFRLVFTAQRRVEDTRRVLAPRTQMRDVVLRRPASIPSGRRIVAELGQDALLGLSGLHRAAQLRFHLLLCHAGSIVAMRSGSCWAGGAATGVAPRSHGWAISW